MSQRTRRPYLIEAVVIRLGVTNGVPSVKMDDGRVRRRRRTGRGGVGRDEGRTSEIAGVAAYDRGGRRRRCGLSGRGDRVPLELVGKVPGTSAVGETSDVERSTAARHDGFVDVVMGWRWRLGVGWVVGSEFSWGVEVGVSCYVVKG